MSTINVKPLLGLREKIAAEGIAYEDEQINDYEKFLALVGLYPQLKAVPTKEIDDIWHLHLSFYPLYQKDCMTALGRVPHHKLFDVIGTSQLHSFRLTGVVWNLHYGEPYGTGCEMAACGVDGDDGVSGPDDFH